MKKPEKWTDRPYGKQNGKFQFLDTTKPYQFPLFTLGGHGIDYDITLTEPISFPSLSEREDAATRMFNCDLKTIKIATQKRYKKQRWIRIFAALREFRKSFSKPKI